MTRALALPATFALPAMTLIMSQRMSISHHTYSSDSVHDTSLDALRYLLSSTHCRLPGLYVGYLGNLELPGLFAVVKPA